MNATTQNTTADELRAQAQALNEKANELSREAARKVQADREAIRVAAEAKRRSPMIANANAVAEAIVRRFNGITTCTTEPDRYSQLPNIGGTSGAGHFVEFRFQYASAHCFRTGPTGVRVIVGDHGSRKSFPQRKDGTFNTAAILTAIVDALAQAREMESARAQRVVRETATALVVTAVARDVKEIVAGVAGTAVCVSSYTSTQVKLTVYTSPAMAVRIAEFIKANTTKE
jgi:hypothetical protein